MIRYGSNLGLLEKCLQAKFKMLINNVCLYYFSCTITVFVKDSAEKKKTNIVY